MVFAYLLKKQTKYNFMATGKMLMAKFAVILDFWILNYKKKDFPTEVLDLQAEND